MRTDTVIVASIDTHTGDTTLFSLPRNLENLPFPPGQPARRGLPGRIQAGSESESLLNAVYRNGPAQHPGHPRPHRQSRCRHAQARSRGGDRAHIDYFVLVNLDGFSRLVDALGGITVNVNYYVPIGGEPTLHILPDAYIAPGPNQHMNGATRARLHPRPVRAVRLPAHGPAAVHDPGDRPGRGPGDSAAEVPGAGETTKDIVSTDIPQSALDAFVDVALLVKDAQVRSLVFDSKVINPAYPDYDRMRALVAGAIASSSGSSASAAPSSSASPATSSTAAPSTGAVPTTGSTADPVTDLQDACVFDPKQAAAALAAGEPPTRRR